MSCLAYIANKIIPFTAYMSMSGVHVHMLYQSTSAELYVHVFSANNMPLCIHVIYAMFCHILVFIIVKKIPLTSYEIKFSDTGLS